MNKTLRIGTRGSALAVAQARLVADALGGAEVVPIKTSGAHPHAGGDKARFVRGVETALLEGEADIGVHSAKDVPAELPEGLAIAAVPAREDPADVWIGSDCLALPTSRRIRCRFRNARGSSLHAPCARVRKCCCSMR